MDAAGLIARDEKSPIGRQRSVKNGDIKRKGC
jgi:hypothetical protein